MSKLYFLGTGNAFGHDGRKQSCYLIKGASTTILLDAGHATLPALRSVNHSLLDIDLIVLSHLHPDHYMGIPQFALENFYVLKRETSVPVVCPVGTRDLIEKVCRLIYSDEIADHLLDLFSFRELEIGGEISAENANIKTFPAKHSGEARMQIIELEGKSVGYTGDTGFDSTNFSKLLEADIVITEASSSGFSIPDHTTLEELREFTIPADKKVFLSHLGSSVIQKEDEIQPPLFLAKEGTIIEY